MSRSLQAVLIGAAAFLVLAVVILFVLIEMPTHDTATWELINGRFLGHWRVAAGEDFRFPAFVAGREDLRIEEVASTGPGTHSRDVVVSWNGVPYAARALVGPPGVTIVYADPAAAPRAPAVGRGDGFVVHMLTLQFDGMIEALESIKVDDPDFDHLFVDFRAGSFQMTSLEGDLVRYVRVAP
jgi:hypothetical protein